MPSSSAQKSHPSSDGFITLPFFVLFMALPYLIGVYFSSHNLSTVQDFVTPWLLPTSVVSQQQNKRRTSVPMKDLENCYQRLLMKMHRGRDKKHQDEPFADLSIVVHRNGQAVPCGNTSSADIMQELKNVLESMNECPTDFADKYQVESLLTRVFHQAVAKQCPSEEPRRSASLGFYGYCDMGESKTPILPDHDSMVPIFEKSSYGNSKFLPCHFHIRQGQRVTSLPFFAQLARHATAPSSKEECASGEDDKETCAAAPETMGPQRRELHLYAVPAGRVFMFTPTYIGEIIQLPHVSGGDPTQPVYLEVLSISPRVFDLVNFFSKKESAELVTRALEEKTESHRVKRSSTGAVGYSVNTQRTSESGFDTSGKTALVIKRRCFDVLGFDNYMEDHSDGLQILRYNLTTAYVPHSDYIDGSAEINHDYESAQKGGNRFATILLYMSDLGPGDGGETVFTEAWPVGQAKEDRTHAVAALKELRDSDQGMILKRGSWEERMVAQCRSRLAIRSESGKAILFYSQHPNGEEDKASMHGGCPVLSGQKWAANLWVWNTPRLGYDGNPRKANFKDKSRKASDASAAGDAVWKKISATFVNEGADPQFEKAELFFENTFWQKMGPSDPPVLVDTFKGHVWNVRVDGKVIHSWTITTDEEEQQAFSV